jgi:hypothetical protein
LATGLSRVIALTVPQVCSGQSVDPFWARSTDNSPRRRLTPLTEPRSVRVVVRTASERAVLTP